MTTAKTDVIVILAEDDDGLRMMTKTLLEPRLGLPITAFRDGAEAWEFIEENHVDLVITDIDMPFMNGLELLRRIKEKDSDIVVICTTGNSDHESKANELGADEFIRKPYKIPDLLEHIQRYIAID